jgi:hypothetical protein
MSCAKGHVTQVAYHVRLSGLSPWSAILSLRRGSSLFSIYLQYMIDVVPVFHPCDHPSSAIPTIDISIGVCVFSVF